MRFDLITLFPEAFESFVRTSVVGKAFQSKKIELHLHQLRDHAVNEYGQVDDAPYGGGPGMLLRVDSLIPAWESIPKLEGAASPPKTLLLSPQGKPLTAARAEELAAHSQLILVCGHYEGVDQRFIDRCVDEEISIGDYVLTGGEIAAQVVIDAVCRFIPGVLGKMESAQQDSFSQQLLKYPQYTRPAEYRGDGIPEILTSGHHAKIEDWRRQRRIDVTLKKRPDLWEKWMKSLRPLPRNPQE